MQVVYIDVLLLVSTVMNLFIFTTVARILSISVRWQRILVGSLLASAIGCLTLFDSFLKEIPTLAYQLLTPLLPILYMYRPETLKKYLKLYVVALLSAMVIGGISFNSYYAMQSHWQLNSWLIPVLSGALLCCILEIGLTSIRKRLISSRYEYRVRLEHNGKTLVLEGFLDTGNQLYTLQHRPVTLIALEDISPLLNTTVVQIIEACKQENALEAVLEKNQKEKVNLISYNSVGKEKGVIVGVPIEKMYIKRGNYERLFENSIVGVTPTKLFKDEMYKVLIHPAYGLDE